MTPGSAIVEPAARPHGDRGVSVVPHARPLLSVRGAQGRLAVTVGRAGAHRVLMLHGTVDLASAPRVGQVLEQAARSRGPLVLDLSHTAVRDTPDIALLVHVVRWVSRSPPKLTIVCPPGPTRAALERSEITASVEIVADRQGLSATSSPVSARDARALVSPTEGVRRPRAGTSARRARLLMEAALAMEERYAERDLELRDIARQIATSERQLQRVFAELGASAFRDELAAIRMQHAARLIHDTQLTVGQIARHVGYRQASQFSKAFRRCYAVTPSAFLRRLD